MCLFLCNHVVLINKKICQCNFLFLLQFFKIFFAEITGLYMFYNLLNPKNNKYYGIKAHYVLSSILFGFYRRENNK